MTVKKWSLMPWKYLVLSIHTSPSIFVVGVHIYVDIKKYFVQLEVNTTYAKCRNRF